MPAKKYDQKKPRMSLVPQQALMEVAKVMTFGANKYGDFNWRQGMDWLRLIDANMRHTSQWTQGQSIDDESGLNHLAHAAANCLMLLEYELNKLGEDNRYESVEARIDSIRGRGQYISDVSDTKEKI